MIWKINILEKLKDWLLAVEEEIYELKLVSSKYIKKS